MSLFHIIFRNIVIYFSNVITVRNSSCGKVMFLVLSVIVSVHRGGCLLLGLGGIHPHPQADIPYPLPDLKGGAPGTSLLPSLGRHLPLGRPPPADTPAGMATAADSTHPTEMHSCLKMYHLIFCRKVLSVYFGSLGNKSSVPFEYYP